MQISATHYQHAVNRVLVGFRGAVATLIFSKTLKQQVDLQDKDASLTHMSSDIDQLAFSLDALCQVWAQVIELAIGLYLLSRNLGWVCVAPIVIVIGRLLILRTAPVVADESSFDYGCRSGHQTYWPKAKRLDRSCPDTSWDDIFYARLDEKYQDDRPH